MEHLPYRLELPTGERLGTVYVNARSWQELGASEEQARRVSALGFAVANAPRPLPATWYAGDEVAGEYVTGEEWQAPSCLHGLFLAAGRADAPIGRPRPNGPRPTLARRWFELDAWKVVLVDNAWCARKLAEILAAGGHSLAEYEAAGIGSVETMAIHGVPWRREG